MSIASAGKEQQARAGLRDKWDRRFMRVAAEVATWSKDPGHKVGAVLVRPIHRVILSTGFNGLPRAMRDVNLEDRDSKLSRTVHAEMNAVLNAGLSPVALHEPITLYVTPLMICDRCAVHLIQAGVTRVIIQADIIDHVPRDAEETKRAEWQRSGYQALRYFEEAHVGVTFLEPEA